MLHNTISQYRNPFCILIRFMINLSAWFCSINLFPHFIRFCYFSVFILRYVDSTLTLFFNVIVSMTFVNPSLITLLVRNTVLFFNYFVTVVDRFFVNRNCFFVSMDCVIAITTTEFCPNFLFALELNYWHKLCIYLIFTLHK